MSEQINVLIAHYLPDLVSGAEYAIADMVDKRHPRFHYTMLTPGEDRLAEFYRSKGYKVWTKKIHTKRRKYPGLHTAQSYFAAKSLIKSDINVVLCNTFPAASRMRTACKFGKIPYGIYIREYIDDNRIHRKILAGANNIFAVSGDVRDHLIPMVDPSKVMVVYDHVNARPIVERMHAHKVNNNWVIPFPPDHPVVGIIGRITPYKQQDLFIQAIPQVLSEIPETRFVVVGASRNRDKDYERYLRRLTSELGIEKKVRFLGHRSDVFEIMTDLTICCIVSTREPFPRTLLEAQVVGCPVIAADSGGCKEMVRENKTGILFSSVNPDAAQQLATAIVTLLRDKNCRQRLSEQARDTVFRTLATAAPVRHFEEQVASLLIRNGKQRIQ